MKYLDAEEVEERSGISAAVLARYECELCSASALDAMQYGCRVQCGKPCDPWAPEKLESFRSVLGDDGAGE